MADTLENALYKGYADAEFGDDPDEKCPYNDDLLRRAYKVGWERALDSDGWEAANDW